MSVLVATDGVGPAPTLTLTWKTPQANTLALASFVAAAVVALIALVIALALWGTRKKRLLRSVHLREADTRASEDTTAIAVGSAVEDLPKRASRKDKAKKIEVAEEVEEASVTEEDTTLGAFVDAFSSSDSTEPYADQETPPSTGTDADESAPTDFAPSPEVEVDAADEAPAHVDVDEGDQADHQEEVVAKGEDALETTVTEPKPAEDDGPTPEERAAAAQEAARTETVTTDSGMMNLMALQGGGKFPTRKAMRDARRRGVEQLVVGDRSFDVPTAPLSDSDPAQALRERSIAATKWSEAMGEKD